MIDNPQYGGTLLYGENAASYAWSDTETGLSGGITPYDPWGYGISYSSGGTAISNYIDANIAEHASYNFQLAVPVTNGSQNFAVAYCNSNVKAAAGEVPVIKFSEGVKRVIQSMDICPTTYLLGCEKNGNDYAKALTDEGDYLTLIITADNGKKVNVDLARNGVILDTWKGIDLSSLGEVNSLSFTMDGNDKGGDYLNTATYFAFDNVVVEK